MTIATDNYRNAYCDECSFKVIRRGDDIRVQQLEHYQTYVLGYYASIVCFSCHKALWNPPVERPITGSKMVNRKSAAADRFYTELIKDAVETDNHPRSDAATDALNKLFGRTE